MWSKSTAYLKSLRDESKEPWFVMILSGIVDDTVLVAPQVLPEAAEVELDP